MDLEERKNWNNIFSWFARLDFNMVIDLSFEESKETYKYGKEQS